MEVYDIVPYGWGTTLVPAKNKGYIKIGQVGIEKTILPEKCDCGGRIIEEKRIYHIARGEWTIDYCTFCEKCGKSWKY